MQLGDVEVELIQPVAGERNAYKEFLEQKGGGIHHVLFEVPDIEVVLEKLGKEGIKVLQAGTGIRPGTRWVATRYAGASWIFGGIASPSRSFER